VKVPEHSDSEYAGVERFDSPVARSDAAHAEALSRVRDFLREHGVSEEEIARAQAEDLLDLLTVDRLLVPSAIRYCEAEVSERSGMPVELSRRFWRALGFPDPTPDDKLFTDLDIGAIQLLESMVELGVADVETLLQLARVVGSSMARIADAEISAAMLGISVAPDSGDSVEAADRFARVADQTLPALGRLLEFVWRRQFQAAVRRAMLLRSRGESTTLPELCVGFADMVGFTMLSQQLSEEELALLVSRFEDVAHDVVTSRGGRVVKMIGDEVMFVTESTTAAAHIGLGLAETYADDKLLSDVRVGLAVGPVLVQDGDYYGPVVNLANRLADIAAPGSVLVTDEFHAALLEELPQVRQNRRSVRHKGSSHDEDTHPARGGGTAFGEESAGARAERFAFSSLRPRAVRDVGRVQLWSLYRQGAEHLRSGHRQQRRWERLSEVMRELDELRERGEKLIASELRVATKMDAGSAPPVAGETASHSGARGAQGVPDARDLSGLGGPKGRDAEGPEREGPVEGGDGPSPQVD
jgi:adenylate cyclase